MKRLVIDDERTFSDTKVPDAVYARSSTEALRLLQGNTRYDEIWLDHDLGGEDTIRPVVHALQEMAHFNMQPTDLVVIHTMNPVGRAYIRSALQRSYVLLDVLVGDYL